MSENLTLFEIGERAKAKSAVRVMSGSRKHGENRKANDFYPTPEIATIALLEREKFSGVIWEPACGDGAISKVLERMGYQVESSDLVDRGYGKSGVDFFQTKRMVDNIITNPPYKVAPQFVHHSVLSTRKKVAMLLRLAFLETKARLPLFTGLPLARVYVFSERLPFVEGNAIAYAWFVWEHGRAEKPSLEWL